MWKRLLAVLLPLTLWGADAPRPAILGVAHIAFYVSDLAKTRAFWTDFLGFQECFNLKSANGDAVRVSFIKINDSQYIELFPEKPRADMMLNHISFLTDNAQAMRDYLAGQGIAVPATVTKGQIGNKNYNVKDPDGNQVEIVEYMPDGWTVRDKGRFLPDTRISTHIRHVGVIIGSVEAANKFYGGVLGFSEIWRGGGDEEKPLSWINMRVPDGADYLEYMLRGLTPEPQRYGTRNHLSLEVPDCEKAAAILKTRPGAGNYKMDAVKVGVNRRRQLNIYDPDGSRVELMEPVTVDGKAAPSSTAKPPIR